MRYRNKERFCWLTCIRERTRTAFGLSRVANSRAIISELLIFASRRVKKKKLRRFQLFRYYTRLSNFYCFIDARIRNRVSSLAANIVEMVVPRWRDINRRCGFGVWWYGFSIIAENTVNDSSLCRSVNIYCGTATPPLVGTRYRINWYLMLVVCVF